MPAYEGPDDTLEDENEFQSIFKANTELVDARNKITALRQENHSLARKCNIWKKKYIKLRLTTRLRSKLRKLKFKKSHNIQKEILQDEEMPKDEGKPKDEEMSNDEE